MRTLLKLGTVLLVSVVVIGCSGRSSLPTAPVAPAGTPGEISNAEAKSKGNPAVISEDAAFQ